MDIEAPHRIKVRKQG